MTSTVADQTETNETTAANPLAALSPVYVDTRNYGYYVAGIILGQESISVPELKAAVAYVSREFRVPGATVEHITSDNGFVIKVSLSRGEINTAHRTELNEIAKPKYVAHAAASAKVHRNTNGRHVGTIVTLTIDDGTAVNATKEDLAKVKGVLRVNIESRPGYTPTVTFSVKNPRNVDVNVVTAAVAELLALHVDQPVSVSDSNPSNALLPAYDAQSDKASADD